jgi:tetratricopeptide (TPR) repeat protein
MKIKLTLAWMCGLIVCSAAAPASDNQIRFYQWRIERDPEDYTGYDHLGSAYLQKARESGDPVYYGLSEKAFLHAQSLLPLADPDSAGLIGHLAGLYLSEHRFEEAITLSQKALNLVPDFISVYATLGDAQLETGRYDQAGASYAMLKIPAGSVQPRPGISYLAETRQASLSYILGKPEAAITHLGAAIALAHEANLAKENIAWTQFSLGELYFGIGDLAHSEEAYQSALRTYPNYHRALAWLGQLRAAQGKYAGAAELYRKALAVIPLPIYAAALGDIYSKLGEKDKAKRQYDLVDVIARLSALNQQLFRRELAAFWSDHDQRLPEALEFAQSELQLRQDVFTWDVVGWAQFKNGQTPAAAQSIDRAVAIGTKDATLFFHAGMIYAALGDVPKAKNYLEQALALNPHFHIVHAETAARTLQGLQ